MKKRKLLLQIGILLFLIFLAVTLLAEWYLLKKSTDMYLQAKDEIISKDMEVIYSSTGYDLILSIVEMWADDPEAYKTPASVEDYLRLEEISDDFSYDTPMEVYEREFNKLSEEDKIILSKVAKDRMHYSLSYASAPREYADFYCLRPIDDDHMRVITERTNYDEMVSEISDATATEANASKLESKKFGDTLELKISDIEGLEEIIDNKEKKTAFVKDIVSNDEAYYVGYYPAYDYKGDLLYLMVVVYDWSDAYAEISGQVKADIFRDIAITVVFSVGIILLFTYVVAVKPLGKVKRTLDKYMDNKDSQEVEARLSKVKAKNEVGVLADDVKELAYEIDRYTADNVSLATETAKVETELTLAAGIQSNALLKEFPESQYFEVTASMNPAKEVGGDFYDVFEIDEDHVGFVIADVSGKGMPAALMMMAAMTSIRNYSMTIKTPSQILSKVNDNFCKRRVMDMFVTVWIGILDVKKGILTTSNAGHEYPAITKDGRFELFKDKHSLVVGGMPGVPYFDHEIQLSKGDRVFVYTDGVPEATNADVKMFGDERMIEALNLNPAAEPEELLKNVKTAVDEFVGDAEQFDDLTMMCIKYKG